MARIQTWVSRQPVYAFYVLAFAISWLGFIPRAAYSHGLFPFDNLLFYVLGMAGPLAAAYIVLRVLRGKEAFGDLFAPLLRWRVSVAWYVVALFGYAAMWIAGLALSGELGSELARVPPLLALLSSYLTYLFAAVPEEVAWRGFALPRLQSRHSALVSSLIVGALWALWHLPLLLTKSNVMSTYPWGPFFIEVVAISVAYTWMFNGTRGSVLIVTVFHAASNVIGASIGIERTLVYCLVAAALLVVFGPAHLSRQNRHTVEDAPETARAVGARIAYQGEG